MSSPLNAWQRNRTNSRQGDLGESAWNELRSRTVTKSDSAITPSDTQIFRIALQQAANKREYQRVLCIWLKELLSLTSVQIGLVIGCSPTYVRKMQSRFATDGIDSFITKRRGGRKRANIPFEREERIMDKFLRRARRGYPLDISEITRVYELSAGKSVSRSTIYRLIARHELRRYLRQARNQS